MDCQRVGRCHGISSDSISAMRGRVSRSFSSWFTPRGYIARVVARETAFMSIATIVRVGSWITAVRIAAGLSTPGLGRLLRGPTIRQPSCGGLSRASPRGSPLSSWRRSCTASGRAFLAFALSYCGGSQTPSVHHGNRPGTAKGICLKQDRRVPVRGPILPNKSRLAKYL
jgi:hypothetical protein